ncbi:MAG: hypothetical protein GY751_10730, partial [Bacteroidetes bacterium]|nr:hypothetical protein [Bacteroidota bacterium]
MTIWASALTGAGFQLFTQSDSNLGIYDDEDDRDDYFDANPTELARLADNQYLIIKILDDGSGEVAYQQYIDPNWLNVTSLVQGNTGPAGATGNSFFFESIAARDTFFGTSPNWGLLENGLPINVNVGDATVSVFTWGGPDVPSSYDETLWRLSALEVSSGTLYLGESGVNISSGSEVMNFISAAGVSHYFHGISYDDTGSNPPAFWKFPALSQIPLADVFDTALSDPQTLHTTNTLNVAVKEYTLIPAATGVMRVQTWLGTDDTGPNIVDAYITVEAGDVGNPTPFQAPNNTFAVVGQKSYTRFSGVQLYGGVQTSGVFTGAITSVVDNGGVAQFHSSTNINASVGQTITLSSLTNYANTSYTITAVSGTYFETSLSYNGDDTGNYGLTTPFVTLGGWVAEQFEFVTQFGDVINIKSPTATGTASINFIDSSDVTQAQIEYEETTDQLNISTPGSDLIFKSGETVFNEASANIDFRVESNTNTHAIFVNSVHGIVGINNDNPVNTLHVYDNNANQEGAVGLQLEQDGIGDAIIQFHLTGVQYFSLGIDNNDSDKFKISPSINLGTDTALTIDTSGKIGAGIDTPVSPFHIYEDTSSTGITAGATIEQDGTGDSLLHFLQTGGRRIVMGIDNNEDIFKIGSSAPLGLYALLAINPASARVGMNISDPVSKLHVYENNSSTGVNSGITIEQDGTGDSMLQFFLTGGNRIVMGIDNDDNGDFKIAGSENLGTSTYLTFSSDEIVFNDVSADIDFRVESNTNTHALFVNSLNGVVGINNDGPVNTLHVYDNNANEYGAVGLQLEQDGVGDSLLQFHLTGGQYYSLGIDNDDSDKFKLSRSIDLNTNTVFEIDASTGEVSIGGKLTVGGLIDPTGLVLTEQASVPDTPAAGYGYLWVKDTTPSTMIFTDDVGTDHLLEAGGGDVTGPSSSTANYIAVFDDTTGKVIAQRSDAYIQDAGSNVYQTLGAAGVGGAANFFLKDSVGGTGGVLGYDSTSGSLTVDALHGILKLQGYGNIQMQIAQHGLLDIILTSTDDDEPAIRIDNSPVTYGAVFDWYFTERTPVGNISATPGSLCFRNNGNSSDIYLHRGTTTNNTDWVDIFESGSGDVVGPSSSTDLSIATFDGTTGKLIQNNSTTTLFTGLSEAVLKINASGSDGDSFIRMGDFGGATLLEFHVDDDSNSVGITAYSTTTAFDISNLATGVDTDIKVTGNASIGLIATSPNTNAPVRIGATGTDGATIQLFTSVVAPEGVITGNPGDICFYKNGASSGIFQLESASASNTGWQTQGGNVDGPASSTIFGIATYADTTGKVLLNNPRVVIHDDLSITEIKLTSGADDGAAKIKLQNYLSTVLLDIYADDIDDSVNIEATSNATAFAIENKATDVDLELLVTGNASVDIGASGANTNPPLRFASLGTNGAIIQVFSSIVAPEGVITGNPGDICIFKDGVDSRMYQLEAASAGNTGWTSQEGGDVDGPATSTQFAIAG